MPPRPLIPFLPVVILLGGLSPMWAVGTVGGEVVGFSGVDAPPALRFMPFAKQLLDYAQRAPERGVAYLESEWGLQIEPEDLTLLADLYGDVDTRVSQRATREIEAAIGAPDARARVLSIGLEASREQSFELGRAFGRWLASLREREYDSDDLFRRLADRAGSASLLGRWVVPREVLEHAESFEGAVAAA
jgi:hypothetical protein